MKKRLNTPAGCLSWLMALSLVLTAAPTAPVFAEESAPAEEYEETGDVVDEVIEDGPSVFVITDFPKLAKDDEGKFIDADIQKEFGDLTALPGTPLDLLGLPEDVQVVGYLEADGADAIQDPFELKDMVWKLKSDSDEVYSETSPAGKYKFVLDLKKYTKEQTEEGTALYDEIKLADGVKSPVIKVTIAEEETEPAETEPVETEPVETEPAETEPAETEPAETEPAETEPQADPSTAGDDARTDGSGDGEFVGDGTWMDNGVVDSDTGENGSFTDDGFVDDGSVDDGFADDGFVDDGFVDDGSVDDGFVDDGSVDDGFVDDGSVDDGFTENGGDTAPAEEDDIFSGLDDSLIGADNGDVWFSDDPQDDGGSADGYVGINDQPISENPALAQGPGPVVIGEGIDGTTEPVIDINDVPDTNADGVDTPDVIDDGTGTPDAIDDGTDTPDVIDDGTDTPDVIDDGTGTPDVIDDSNTGDPVVSEPRTVYAAITLTDANGLTVTLPADPSDMTAAPMLTSGQTAELSVTIPCGKNGFSLTGVSVKAEDVQGTTTLGVSTVDEQGAPVVLNPATIDFEDGIAKEITFASNETDANGANYTFPVKLTVTRQAHTPGTRANCEEPILCSVCGAQLEAGGQHTPSTRTNCEDPIVCTVCGVQLEAGGQHTPSTRTNCEDPIVCTVCGVQLEAGGQHTPSERTNCEDPIVCSVCGVQIEAGGQHTPGDPATCLKEQTCTVCGAVLAEKADHTPGDPATCTEPQTCTVCGKVLAPAKGHTAGDPATCTEPQTCTECGAVLAPALGHDYDPATCEEPKTCTRCGATKGKPLGHKLEDDWEVVTASTDTEHGTEIRYCQRDDCDYSEERALNIIGKPENNGISGIDAGANYNLNTLISFTAYGSGMGNQDPVDGDVRYVPLSWAVQSTPGAFKDNYSGGFSVTQSGTYTLTVTYQQQKYQGSWQSTNETDTKTVTFTVGNVISATPTEGIRINPQTGDNTPILGFVIALAAAAVLIIAMLIYKKKRSKN